MVTYTKSIRFYAVRSFCHITQQHEIQFNFNYYNMSKRPYRCPLYGGSWWHVSFKDHPAHEHRMNQYKAAYGLQDNPLAIGFQS